MRLFVFLVTCLCCLPVFSQSNHEKQGLLVMAHGGSEEWNAAIIQAVEPLRYLTPLSIAFGMADPTTLQVAINELERQGVHSIRVVRMFVSAESFLPETEYAFGLRETEPSGHFMFEPLVLQTTVPVSLNGQGLMDASQVGGILADRAAKLSNDSAAESVLIVGHGPGDDQENERWLAKMNSLADSVRADAGYYSVRVATLREDWTGKRKKAERALRQFVTQESENGRTVIVVPFRLYGFGPYADVLDGLPYSADSLGFLPDARITDWIRSQYNSSSQSPAFANPNPYGQK